MTKLGQVARAIAEVADGYYGGGATYYEMAARAAVEALRPAHILTGVSEYAWNAAIDAILNEKPE